MSCLVLMSALPKVLYRITVTRNVIIACRVGVQGPMVFIETASTLGSDNETVLIGLIYD